VLLSELPPRQNKPRAGVNPVMDKIPEPTQSASCTVDTLEEGGVTGGQFQELADEDDYQQTEEQHTSSKQKVGEPLLKSSEFDDTDELNIDDTAERTINNTVIDEIFPDHSSSIIRECEVSGILDIPAYPNTLEGCRREIDELCHSREASFN